MTARPGIVDEIRTAVSTCDVVEMRKWAKPCFVHDGHNIAIVQEMKDFVALMFFKGALLDDPDGLLVDQGPNSRSAKRMEFRDVADVRRHAAAVRGFVTAAIEVERAGRSVPPVDELELVAELRERLDDDPQLAVAFAGLTPGRRREYHLHVSSAKQSATRASRVDQIAPRILAGKGLRDRS
jgi:uncharacterized protein YdeI (YjbR/CyaY-like superfamily)